MQEEQKRGSIKLSHFMDNNNDKTKSYYDYYDYRDVNIISIINKCIEDSGNLMDFLVLVGGSVRFPYHNRPSNDLDLFIYIDGEEKFLKFIKLLDLNYTYRPIYVTGDRFVHTSIFNRELDLTFIFNKESFDKLAKDFNDVEDFLNMNSTVRNVLQRLHFTTGFDKYIAVRGMVNNEDLDIINYSERANRVFF